MTYRAFLFVSIGSALIPIIFFLLSKGNGHSSRILFILLLDSIISDVASVIYIRSGYQGDLMGNIYFITQFLLIGQFYVLQTKEKKNEIYGVFILFLIISIFHFTFYQSINEYQGVLRFLSSLIILYYAVSHCIHLYITRTPPTESLFQFFPAWVTIAVIYYFSLNLILFAFANYVFENTSTETSMIFWAFHNVNNIVKNVLFAVGLYKGVEGR